MGFKRTLTNIVGSALIAGSTLIGSCQSSHAQKTESYESVHTIQLSPQKTRDSKEIPVKLFQYQQHNKKLVSMGETVLPVEAEMDYESGQLLVSYSSGRITDDGPDLSKFSKKERKSLQGTQLVPRLNDSHTLAVVVSSCPEGVDVKYEGQMGWLMGAKENPVSLIPSDKKLSHQLFLYAGNEGIDKLVDLGAKKISYGLTDGWDELIDQIGAPDKYKVDASGRTRRFLEGLRDKERARQERHAESSLEKGVSMGILDLHNDPKPGLVGRHMVARSIDLALENNTFEDQEVALYFNQIRIGQKASHDDTIGTSAGSKFGDVRDIEVRVKLPSIIKSYIGKWESSGGLMRGKPLPDGDVPFTAMSVNLNNVEFKSREGTLSSGPLVWLGDGMVGFYLSGSSKGGIIKGDSHNKINLAIIRNYSEGDFEFPSRKDIDNVFQEDVMFLRRVDSSNREESSSENYLGRWMLVDSLNSIHSRTLPKSTRTSPEFCSFSDKELVINIGSGRTNSISWVSLPLKDYAAMKLDGEDYFIFLKRTNSREVIMTSPNLNKDHFRDFKEILDLGSSTQLRKYLDGIFSYNGLVLRR